MSTKKSTFIGILGDGQLARMLCLEAHKLNISIAILTTSKDSPAALVNSNNFICDQINQETVQKFAEFCVQQNPEALLTIESEFIDPEFIINAQNKTNIKVFPSVDSLKLIRDRKPQKNFLIENNLPTSPMIDFKDQKNLIDYFENIKPTSSTSEKNNSNISAINSETSKPDRLVFKKRLFGYDGYGTVILNNHHDLSKLPKNFDVKDWICEHFINFKRELAISFARNTNGEVCIFPWVETYQENSKCLWVKGPQSQNEAMKSLQTKIKAALNKINYVGFITFEVFETENSELFINEVAPRVHNSAHYSLDALYLNQFKAHLLAGLNFTLPEKPKVISAFAMYNLIASKEENNPIIPQNGADYFLHWYQKNQSRPGRKMGHITSLASTFDEALLVLKNKSGDFNL